MRLPNAVVIGVALWLAACGGPSGGNDGGSGGTGGGTGGGGSGGSGGGSGGSGGGSGGSGGGSGGSGGGSGAPFDAGSLSCTFEAPFVLGPAANPAGGLQTVAVAVTAAGEAIYVWNGGDGIHYRVQAPGGTLGPDAVDPDAGTVPSVVVVAREDRALLAYASGSGSTYEVRTRRFTTAGGWEAMEKTLPTSTSGGDLRLALEPDGTASLWRQAPYGSGPITEYTSTGAGPLGNPHPLTTGGFTYSTARGGGTRLAITLDPSTATVPEAVFTDGAGDTRNTLTGARYTSSDPYLCSVADDGSAVIAGAFTISGALIVGGVTRTSAGLSSPQALSTAGGDGGVLGHRTLAALAGPAGRALVVWFDLSTGTIYSARNVPGTGWTAPQPVAAASPFVIPRFSKLSAARGLAHFYGDGGQPARVELNVDGFVGPERPSPDFPGPTYGVEFAAANDKAAAIKTSQGSDGGWTVTAAQCR